MTCALIAAVAVVGIITSHAASVEARQRRVVRPGGVRAGAKRVSTNIFSVYQLRAIENAREARRARWVAGHANPRAHAGAWNKGNLDGFPDPSPRRRVRRPAGAKPGAKKVSTNIFSVYQLRAIENAREARRARWVAGHANPKAHAGAWNKGNLDGFPNPSPRRGRKK
jgi:hypothetical protein